MDTEGIQGTRDSDSCEARKELEGMEGEGSQGLQPGVPDRRMPTQARLPRLPEGRSGTCEARPGELLAPQVPRYVRHPVSLGGSRSAYSSAVARSLRYGEHDAVLKAFTKPADAGKGE